MDVIANCAAPDEDTGAQMCFLAREVIEELGLKPGWCVRVSDYICRVFPSSHLPRNELQKRVVRLEPTVTFDLLATSGWRGQRECRLEPVNGCPSVESVRLTLVHDGDKSEPVGGLENALKTYLEGLYIGDRSYVALDGFTPFSHVFVEFKAPGNVTIGRVSSKTRVELTGAVSFDRLKCKSYLSLATAKLLPLSSFNAAEEELLKLHNLIQEQHSERLGNPVSRGFLLTCLPGNGKTKLVESFCHKIGALLVKPSPVAITDGHPGETEKKLESVFKSALNHCSEGPVVLVFDPVDSFCPASSKPRRRRLALRFLELLETFLPLSGNLFVVGVSAKIRGGFDQSLVAPGRLVSKVSLGVPTESDALLLLKHLLQGVREDSELLAERLSVESPGYSLADLVNLARELWESKPLTDDVVRKVHIRTRPAFTLARKLTVQNDDARVLGWDSIGGLDSVKAALKRAVEWPLSRPEVFARMGIKVPKGILLYGPPGCGKTRLVRVAAAAAKAHFFALDPAEIFSPFVGESEKTIAEAFHLARLGRRSVLFIDEIDAIVAARSAEKASKRVHEAVLSALLNEMDGIEAISDKTGASSYLLVVAATNRPYALDSALLRPGRFDWLIHVPEPDEESRVRILETCGRRIPMAKDVDFGKIGKMTNGASGADLENLCREAALLAMTEESDVVEMRHFEEVMLTTRVTSISPLHVKEIDEFKQRHGKP